MNPNVLYTGLGCLLLGCLLVFRNERSRRRSVVRPRRNPILGPVREISGGYEPQAPVCGQPKFLCWVCCQPQVAPAGLPADSTQIIDCPECNINSEIKVVPLDPGELYLGKMPVTNRVASYL